MSKSTHKGHCQASADRFIFDTMKGTRLVAVCSWCPDSREKTKRAASEGYSVTHVMCPACVAKFEAIMEGAK